MALELHKQAGIKPGKCGLDEVRQFQSLLADYQIYIISKEHFNAIIYSGPESSKKIYLYYHDNHYDIISSMSGFLSRNYYCTHCNNGYSNKEDHKCNLVCHACRKVHEETDEVVGWIGCEKCHRFFKGERCFALHEKVTAKGNSTCLAIYRCTNCEKTVNKKWIKTISVVRFIARYARTFIQRHTKAT